MQVSFLGNLACKLLLWSEGAVGEHSCTPEDVSPVKESRKSLPFTFKQSFLPFAVTSVIENDTDWIFFSDFP